MLRNIIRKPPFTAFEQLLDYTAGISLDRTLPELDRTYVLPAAVGGSVSMVHIDAVQQPGQYGTKVLTANTDGTLTVDSDILAFKITCMAVCRYPVADNVILGIGIGDPANLPSEPGTSTDILPLGTYVSRFRDASKGEGARSVTLKTPYFPVGKELTRGALAGDKVFPVMWTEEGDASTVVIDDFIFVVEVVPQ